MTPTLLPKNLKQRKSSNQNPKPPQVSLKRHHVVKTTKSQPIGSDQVRKVGDGIGENQGTQKNMEGESVINHPRHVAASQKVAIIDMDENTLLFIPSQKGLDIEKSSHPGALGTLGGGGGVTKAKQITPYVRKKKGKQNTNNTWGAHTSHS